LINSDLINSVPTGKKYDTGKRINGIIVPGSDCRVGSALQ